jgi:NADH-quinone oxidoreductase subunit E
MLTDKREKRRTVLTEEERREIEEEIRNCEQKHYAVIEAMRIIQKHRGWIPDETIKEVSELLDMTADELDGTATFYSLIFRKPVGRHVILICDSISCWITGYEKIVRHLKTKLGIELGETSADGRFTLLPIACIGACDNAPAMIIDNEVYRNLEVDKIDDILGKYK